MADQVNYYNYFGTQYSESILACSVPELWTTDFDEKGRVYREMKERIKQQQELIFQYFNKNIPVLDIGCGFGRQAIVLASNGFQVTGTDTSTVFIDIVKKLFKKHGYKGNFLCIDITKEEVGQQYKQILLLDVLEHVKPFQRLIMFERLSEIAEGGAIIIISLPHVKKRLTSQLNNTIRRRVTQYFSYFLSKEEHPYPVPQKKHIFRLISDFFSLNKFIESLLN